MKVPDLLRQASVAIDWLHQLGVQPSARWNQNLQNLYCSQDLASENRLKEWIDENSVTSLIAKIADIHELLLIYSAFKNDNPATLQQAIKRVGRGPEDYPDESNNSAEARNIQFELALAAIFKHAGFTTRIADGDAADIEILAPPDYRLFVECKRPMKWETISENTAKALAQLQVRIPKTSRSLRKPKGIVALSLTKAINPTSGYLEDYGSHIECTNRLNRIIMHHLHPGIEELERNGNKNVIAIIGYAFGVTSKLDIYTQMVVDLPIWVSAREKRHIESMFDLVSMQLNKPHML